CWVCMVGLVAQEGEIKKDLAGRRRLVSCVHITAQGRVDHMGAGEDVLGCDEKARALGTAGLLVIRQDADKGGV
ncbi:MAG: hypothetical protein D3922_12625, partial [Candidatus Electrothrix sp. AR1]|nr:hypothetical protein [Candidatus Electrothrix sp. AR1]